MESHDNIKELAYKYFSGTIPFQDEKKLFAFINASESNKTLFHTWEREWMMAEGLQNHALDDKWHRLTTKIDHDRRIYISFKHSNSYFSQWLSIAASIMLILSLSVYLLDKFTEDNPVSYFISEVPKGQKSKLILPDGTIVWLNGGSKLKYPDSYSINNRKVTLDGEGYFEVTKQDGAYFTVSTELYDVVVKGTKFNVSAYAGDMISSTSLLEGKAEIDYNDRTYEVFPGENIILNKETGLISRQSIGEDNPEGWINDYINYNAITFSDLVTKLSRKYGVDIIIERNELKDKKFSLSLRNNETLIQVLDGLKLITPFEYEEVENSIIIK